MQHQLEDQWPFLYQVSVTFETSTLLAAMFILTTACIHSGLEPTTIQWEREERGAALCFLTEGEDCSGSTSNSALKGENREDGGEEVIKKRTAQD